MSLYKFDTKDVLVNRIKAHPKNVFFVSDGKIYYSNRNEISGENVANITHVDTGFINLYELNVDRDFSAHTYNPKTDSGVKAKIFPFITKNSSLSTIATISTNEYNQFLYGDIITGSYPLSSSIERSASLANQPRRRINALKNVFDYYKIKSPHHAYSSSLGDKSTQEINLISIPSIFYGSSIKRNSVKLNFYISGTLVAACEDIYHNGTLIQTSGTSYAQSQGSGSVAGVVLYNEGFVVLTGSWNLTEATFDLGGGSAEIGTWTNFAVGANDSAGTITPSASFSLEFRGTNYINTMTMFADAPKGELNYSSNPTFVQYNQTSSVILTSSRGYFEDNERTLKNTVSSSFYDYDAKFKRQVFISKIGIYDEDRNLIAVANLSKPIKKVQDRDFTFKLSLDI